MSYIIRKGTLIASIPPRKSGSEVLFSRVTCREQINANRSINLVDAQTGKVSNAEKWKKEARKIDDLPVGLEVNPGEFKLL